MRKKQGKEKEWFESITIGNEGKARKGEIKMRKHNENWGMEE